MLFGQFQYCSKGSDTVRTVSFLSRRFQYCPDSFKTVRTVLILSGRFQYCLDGFNAVQTVSILSGWFQNCPDSFNTVWTINSQICIAFCISGTQFIWRSIEHHKKDVNALSYVARYIYAYFICCERGLRFFWRFMTSRSARFVRKKNCALNVAIRKVLGFCACAAVPLIIIIISLTSLSSTWRSPSKIKSSHKVQRPEEKRHKSFRSSNQSACPFCFMILYLIPRVKSDLVLSYL